MSDRYINDKVCGIEPEREGDEPTLEQWRAQCRKLWSENVALRTVVAWMDETPECRAAKYRALVIENGDMRGAIFRTLQENAHLADGDACTLIHLKRAIAAAI